jgi:hypothetical protein
VAERHRHRAWLSRAPPMSRVTRANGTDRRGSSAAELTDIGPRSTVTGLDEHELAILRQVGRHWCAIPIDELEQGVQVDAAVRGEP